MFLYVFVHMKTPQNHRKSDSTIKTNITSMYAYWVSQKNVPVSRKKVLESCLFCCAMFKYMRFFLGKSGSFLWDRGTFFCDIRYCVISTIYT